MTDPDSPRTLVSVAAIFFVNGAVYGSWAPRLPELRHRVGVSLAELGVVLSGAALFAVGATLVAGIVVDRIGSRRATATAGLVTVIGLAGIGAAQGPLLLLATLAVVSAGDVVQDVAMNVQATTVSEQRANPVISRLHGLWSLGAVVGGLTAAWMAAGDFALGAHLLIAAVLLGATTIAAVPGLVPVDSQKDTTAHERPATHGDGGRPRVALALLGFLAMAIELTPADWSALRLVEDLDTPPATAGLAFGAFSTGMLIGRFAGDELVTRLGAKTVLIAGSLVAAVGITWGMLSPHATLAIVGFAVAGLGVAPVFPRIYAESARMPGLGAGSGIAAMMTGQRIGALILPVVVGVLANSDALEVGQAVVLIALPAAVAVAFLVSRTFSRAGP